MQDGFLDVFEPVNVPDFSNAEGVARIADRIEAHRFDARPMLEGARVAIFGVNDGRRSGDNEGCAAAPDAIREWFYQLAHTVLGSPRLTWATSELGLKRRTLTRLCIPSSRSWFKWASSPSSWEAGTT